MPSGNGRYRRCITQLNQYHVVMEVEPEFWQSPEGLKQIYVRAANGGVVPLSAFTHYEPTTAPLAVNHQGQFPSVTLSFNLAPGVALSDAVSRIHQTGTEYGNAGDNSWKLLRDSCKRSRRLWQLNPF